MALIKSGTTGAGSPLLQYELYADQTAGSGNDRTIKITFKAKPNGNGYYGYPVNWRANINGSWSGWMTMKGSESWSGSSGFKTFTYTATTNVGTTSSKAITVGFNTDSYNGDNDWDSTVTGSFTVGVTNRAPNPPSNIVVRNGSTSSSPVIGAGIVPENISNIYVTWNAASDPDGDSLNYALNQSINSGGYTQADWGPDLAHSYIPSGWNEGNTIQFYVDAQDSKGAWSSKVYSGVFTKNRLTAGTFTGHSNDINFDTSSFELMFGGGENTDKTAVTYSCYSDSVNIYNQTYTSSTKQTILVWKSNQPTPSVNQPYIKFDDLINLYKTSGYTGRLQVGLRTKNNYGTIKSTTGSIGVNLQVVPEAPSNVNITGGTAKKLIAGGEVYLPNGVDTITFSWNHSTNSIGAPFSYDLYQLYNGVEVKITNVDSNTNSYSFVPQRQIGETANLGFKVVAITSYGASSFGLSSNVKLEYYRDPSISIGEITRTDTTASFSVSIIKNTSITSINGVANWTASNKQTGAIENVGNVNLINLLSDSTYSVIVVYGDNSGLIETKTETISVGKNLPIMDINQYGVGIGGVSANSNRALNVNGFIEGTQVFDSGSRVYSPKNPPPTESIDLSKYLSISGGTLTGTLVVPRLELKDSNAFLTKDTLRLEKGYGGNYSQIFFKGQQDDDGRIIHWEKANASQLWLMPSDDANAATDEVIIGSISGKNATTDLDGATWSKAFSFKLDRTFVMEAKSNSTSLNGLYNESCSLTSNVAPGRPIDYCYVRTFGTGDGYTMQLASYYGAAHQYFLRSQQDTTKAWKGWARIVLSDHNNIYSLRNAGTYMHVETSSGAKGIDWWNSDLKFKENVVSIEDYPYEKSSVISDTPGISEINKIEHFSFDYNLPDDKRHIKCGYVAQQLESVNKNFVTKIDQPEDSPFWSKETPYTLAPNATVIIPYLSKAIKELYEENIRLKQDIQTLSNENFIISREVATIQRVLGMTSKFSEEGEI